MIGKTVHSSVLLRYPLQRYPLTDVFSSEMGSRREKRCVWPPHIVTASHVDPLRVQARAERVVEDPEVAGHRV